MPQHGKTTALGHVPDPRGSVFRRRCQPRGIRGETDREDAAGMSSQFSQQRGCLDIPEANRTVATGGGDPVAACRKGDAVHVPVAGRRSPRWREDRSSLARIRIPEGYGAIGRRRGNGSSVGRKPTSVDRSGVATQAADRPSIRDIPDDRLTVLRRRHGQATVT